MLQARPDVPRYGGFYSQVGELEASMSKARIIEAVKNLDVAGSTIDVVVGVTPFLASWCWRRFDAAGFLALKGANVNFQDRKRKTALHHGVEKEFEPASLKRDQRFLAALS